MLNTAHPQDIPISNPSFNVGQWDFSLSLRWKRLSGKGSSLRKVTETQNTPLLNKLHDLRYYSCLQHKADINSNSNACLKADIFPDRIFPCLIGQPNRLSRPQTHTIGWVNCFVGLYWILNHLSMSSIVAMTSVCMIMTMPSYTS